MKAAIIQKYGGPDVIEISDMPIPKPGPDDVLIRVKASSVNPVDYKIRKGNHKYTLGTHFPIILGFDAAGIVEETGSAVTRFKKGDRVYGRLDKKYGKALAQFAVGSSWVFEHIPDTIDYLTAAAIPLAASTALQALRDKAQIKSGESVLIIGATGGVGHFAVQVAQNYLCTVTAVCGNGNEKILETLKPHHVINYTLTDILAHDKTYDVIFDAAGKYTFPKILHLLNKGGRYVHTLPRPKIIWHKLRSLFTEGKRVYTLLMKANHFDLEIINQWIAEKRFTVFIDSVYSLDEIPQAHHKAEQYHTKGKIVIEIPA